jgi:hypothetical protein
MADSPQGTMGPVNWGSNIVNGQLIPQAPTSAFWPTFPGSQVRGPGYWPRQGSWQVPPVMPSAGVASQQSPNTGGASNFGTPTQASRNPWHPTQGTIIAGFGFLVVGLLMLNYIHYGRGK